MPTYTSDATIYDGQSATGNVVEEIAPADFATKTELGAHTGLTTGAHGGLVPTTRQITINGVAHNLGADQTWTIGGGVAGWNMTVTSADNTGATDATAQLAADLATAVAAGHRRLYLPAGTYTLTGKTGALIDLASAGCELFGDGIGKTILSYAETGTLTGDVFVVRARARNIRIRDLSITGGGAATFGTKQALGVFVQCNSLNAEQAFDCIAERVEMFNWAGGAATLSGGAGFGTECAYDLDEYTTTLTAAISSTGSQTATPASMNGIYVGRLLLIDSEYVQVTARTATTFTATYTATHANGATVHLRSWGHQRAAFVDCTVRDSRYTTGFGIPSNANWLTRCRVINVGDSSLRHGFYIQGGQNVFEGCHVEGVSGWSYHGWKKGPSQESGGDRFLNCVSIDPGYAHFIASGTSNGGANPSVPSGLDLDRYNQVLGCTFRSSSPLAAGYAVNFDSPTLFDGNVVENGVVQDSVGGCIISNNKLIRSAFTSNSPGIIGITAAAGTRVIGNYIDGGTTAVGALNNGIDAGANALVQGNWVRLYGGSAKAIRATGNVQIIGNYIDSDTVAIDIGTGAAHVVIKDNIMAGAGQPISGFDFSLKTGAIVGNRFVTASWLCNQIPVGLLVEGNVGNINPNSRTATAHKGTEGPIRQSTLASGQCSNGHLVKWSSGTLVKIGTSDAVFAGVATAEALNAGEIVHYVASPGRDCLIKTDGAWTIGNVGVVSSTTAGTIHDSGSTTPPASGSYAVFLDSGGGAGSARCLLVKLL